LFNKSGFDRVIALLSADLTHIAVGNGTTPTYIADKLSAETFRNSVSETFTDGLVLGKELYLDESQANGNITEIGLFGTGATSAVNSGKLFSSFSADFTKTSSQSLTLSFEIEVLEVTS